MAAMCTSAPSEAPANPESEGPSVAAASPLRQDGADAEPGATSDGDWRLLLGASAAVRVADGSALVRAQLVTLLVLITQRYASRCRAGCHQLLLLRSFGAGAGAGAGDVAHSFFADRSFRGGDSYKPAPDSTRSSVLELTPEPARRAFGSTQPTPELSRRGIATAESHPAARPIERLPTDSELFVARVISPPPFRSPSPCLMTAGRRPPARSRLALPSRPLAARSAILPRFVSSPKLIAMPPSHDMPHCR